MANSTTAEINTTDYHIVGKNKDKEDDVDKIFIGVNFCREVYEIHNK